NVGRGYWGRPRETEISFGNKLQSRLEVGSHATGVPEDALWFRTGDLGMYLDGELYITGRIKDMIIVDGRNHYPQDVEATVPDADGRERLVIIAERAPGAGKADPEPIRDTIRAAVSRYHALPIHDIKLVAAGAIPRTTSGKLARRACRAEYLAGEYGPVAR